MTVPISVARDAHGSFHVRVADDDASVERIDTPALLVGYFANYGAPYLIDLRNALAGIDGFDEICRMADQQLRHPSPDFSRPGSTRTPLRRLGTEGRLDAH